MINDNTINALHSVFPELSRKQLEIVTLYAHGNAYETIADICNISVETVRSHLKRSTRGLRANGTKTYVKELIHCLN
jgi:DNA-binding CsgD family transcriptional regulator